MAELLIGKEERVGARPDSTVSPRSPSAATLLKALAIVALVLGFMALARAPVAIGDKAFDPSGPRVTDRKALAWAPSEHVAYFPAQFGEVVGTVNDPPVPTF